MNRAVFVVGAILLSSINLNAQEEEKKKDMPRLEIPEITIVGKKAISLPFARKGEVMEVELYELPPPDSSILAPRPMAEAPKGSLPRFHETTNPLKAFLEGELGSHPHVGLGGIVRYAEYTWEGSVRGGFISTKGHTAGADASRWWLGAEGRTIVETDNDLLRRFRAVGNAELNTDSYKLFGLKPVTVERRRTEFALHSRLSTMDVNDFKAGVDVAINTMSVEDRLGGASTDASMVSPEISLTAGYDVRPGELTARFRYASSLLDFSVPVESPSLVEFVPTYRWASGKQWSAQAGLKLSHGSNSNGGSSTLVSPVALVRLTPSGRLSATVWWDPFMNSPSPIRMLRENPYIHSFALLNHERSFLNVGGSVGYTLNAGEVKGSLSFLKTDTTPIHLADSLGNIALSYANTAQVKFEAGLSQRLSARAGVEGSGTIHVARETGRSTQLPMVPPVQATLRGEWSFDLPVIAWSSLNFTGSRNVDRAGTRSMPAYVLMNIGASSTFVPSTLMSIELENVLGSSYEWWSGYRAPGQRLTLRLQYTL